MRIYLSNKMSGIPYFNAPWFDRVSGQLLALPGVREVFNPAEEDRRRGFDPMNCPGGTFEEARAAGFDAADALAADWLWIAKTADCVVVGPNWRDSPGAISEVACIQARRKPAFDLPTFLHAHNQRYLPQLALPPIMEMYEHPRFAVNPWKPWEIV